MERDDEIFAIVQSFKSDGASTGCAMRIYLLQHASTSTTSLGAFTESTM